MKECTGASIAGEIEIDAPPEVFFDALVTAEDRYAVSPIGAQRVLGWLREFATKEGATK